eukprot:scaffold2277_cov256-Pinguiococcus_pyrenoidosus.AAC.26
MEEKPLPANVEPIPKDTAPAKPAKDAAPESAGESKASGAPSEPKDPEAPAASSAPAATPCLPAFLWFGKGKGRKSTAEQVEEALQKLKEEMRAENEALRAQMEKQTELLEDNAEELRQLREEVKGWVQAGLSALLGSRMSHASPRVVRSLQLGQLGRMPDTCFVAVQGAARAWRRAGCGFTASATRFLEFVREIIEAESARSKRSGRHEQNAYLGVLRELTAGDILNCITREAVRHATDDPNPESNPADEQEGVVRVRGVGGTEHAPGLGSSQKNPALRNPCVGHGAAPHASRQPLRNAQSRVGGPGHLPGDLDGSVGGSLRRGECRGRGDR